MKGNGFWKVCAALDNPIRLELLRYLLAIEREAFPCVTEIAKIFRLSTSTASGYLKKLADTGLIASKREDKRIYYRAFATTKEGAEIVDAYRLFFESKPGDKQIEEVAKYVHALAHYRRHAIVRCLSTMPGIDLKTLCAKTEMPDATADRLLAQLYKGNVVNSGLTVIPQFRPPESALLKYTLA